MLACGWDLSCIACGWVARYQLTETDRVREAAEWLVEHRIRFRTRPAKR